MLSISEFARYLGVSARMLRHYDALGLLVPARVDPVTGYRHYTAAQLDRGNRLVALKELGFALDQIGPVLDAEVSVTELRAMLTLRRAQVAEQIAADRGPTGRDRAAAPDDRRRDHVTARVRREAAARRPAGPAGGLGGRPARDRADHRSVVRAAGHHAR